MQCPVHIKHDSFSTQPTVKLSVALSDLSPRVHEHHFESAPCQLNRIDIALHRPIGLNKFKVFRYGLFVRPFLALLFHLVFPYSLLYCARPFIRPPKHSRDYYVLPRVFLQRVGIYASCYADGCISHGRVRLSVCLPSHAGIVSRRMKLRSCGFHRQVGQSS